MAILDIEKRQVRIRLNSSQRNKECGFYILLTSGSTYSDKEHEFIVEERLLKKLEESKVVFEKIPLNN